MPTLPEILESASRHLRSGRMSDAEAAYRAALHLDPRNLTALYHLGVLAMEAGQFDEAVRLYSAAIELDERQAAFHASLGDCFRHLGRPAEAECALRRALELEPGWVQVASVLGTLLQSQGRFAEASECFRRVVVAEPSADAHFDLGSALQMLGQVDAAARCYTAALGIDPNHALSLVNQATIHKQQGRLDEAVQNFQRALALQPGNAVALGNLGATYELQGLTDEALICYRNAITASPAATAARISLGALLQRLGQLDEAEACFTEVLRISPRSIAAHHGLASVYYARQQLDEALAACRRALEIDPSDAQTYLNMSKMLNEQARRDEAIEYGRRAIELDPKLPSAHGNLAVALHLQGRVEEALEHHRREIELNPNSALHHSNYLYCLNYHPGLDAQTIFAEHRLWGQRHADPFSIASPPHANDRSPDRRLRIGYVSPHFYGHAVNFFTEPILSSHDHANFEVFCYSDVAVEDDTTARLRTYADHWRAIRGQGHEHISRQIRHDAIDILVDLTGHIGGNRLPMFARKPAPLQATYIGYQNTTGMQAMDVRFTDAYADPPGQTELLHSERLMRLPQTFFCYQPSIFAPPVGTLPANLRGNITFGSFNSLAKINREVLAAWAAILRAVPQSRLVLLAEMTASVEQSLRETFSGQGVEPRRLELVRRLPREKYLDLISSVDIALDPFPFNGHTTTCDCLWQGVPVVTLSGQTYVSRFGGSGLATLGLTELISHSRDQYIATAVALANDRGRLADYRSTLRQRMAASPLLDFEGFTRNLEAAYRDLWRGWCQAD